MGDCNVFICKKLDLVISWLDGWIYFIDWDLEIFVYYEKMKLYDGWGKLSSRWYMLLLWIGLLESCWIIK